MKIFRIISAFALTAFLFSCAGTQQNMETDHAKTSAEAEKKEYANVSRLEGITIETVKKEHRLAEAYKNVIFNPVQISGQLASDYPDAAMQFQISMVSQLKNKNLYKSVEVNESEDFHPRADTLIADARIIDMRIVSVGARIWAGAFAGSSFMDIYIKLTDASTGNAVLEKIISSHNNAFASAWAIGTENSLPMDMGKIAGEYLAAVVPAK
ncbi:MAG: hypothetical protein AB7S75_03570 [Desulfococcaceae bacterium]